MLGETRKALRSRIPPWLIPVVGYAVSIGCLIWVYRGFDWKGELPKLLATDWRWVTLAVVSDVAVYVIQGWRWKLLLKPLKELSLIRTVQAVYIGLFANEVLPLRTGEVIRCYLLGKWNRLRFSVVVSSAVLERLFDGIWLVAGFYVITLFVELPRLLVEASKVLGLVLVVAVIVMGLAIYYKGRVYRAIARSSRVKLLRMVINGLHVMGNSRSFWWAFIVSLLYLALQIVPVYALVRGYGLDLSLGAAAVVLVILRLGSIPPQAPSNVGAFQFFTILGVRLFGIPRPQATGFATLLFLVVTVPLWLVGFIALLATKMKLEEIHRDAHDELDAQSAIPLPARPADV